MKAVILAGGPCQVNKSLLQAVSHSDMVIAADSGLRHAAPLGLEPNVIVGDFDSVSTELLKHYPTTPRLEHSPNKDLLDLELALEHARVQGADNIVIVGAIGGRFDQSLAALLIAARLQQEVQIFLHSGNRQVYLLRGEDKLELSLSPGQRFSLLSLAAVSVVSVRGAAYPLDKYALEFGVGLGVSNLVKQPPLNIELDEGLLTVIVE